MSLNGLFFNAFASRPRPSASQIIRGGVRSDEAGEVRQHLARRTRTELTDDELRSVVEGNLWMLSPDAFLYFLPALLRSSLESYASVSVLASELIGALTEPTRADVENGVARTSSGLGLPEDMTELLRKQQLEWFDSGTPSAVFHERFDGITHEEGAAILAFLVTFREAHGADFPFGELETAIERYWARYRAS